MLTRREVNRVSKILNALGNPIRFRILELVGKTDRPLHIKAVAQHLRKDYAAIYRHIKILEKCGLLEVYEVGRSRVLRSKNVEAIKAYLSTNDMHTLGRYGNWEYSGIEHAILNSKRFTESLKKVS